MKKIDLTNIPKKPGVYLFKNKAGDILYIGKAKLLKNRVSSYFHKSNQLSPSKKRMVWEIAKLKFIITSSETEALLLESGLIKKYQPPYNIDLKDDKNFLYIKITTKEDFPRVFTTRKVNKDQAKYFGPFVSAGSARQTLRLLRKLFPHRNFQKTPSAYHLKFLTKRYPELLGPQNETEYQRTINKIIQFLKGHYEEILTDLEQKMNHLSAKKQFEKAATLRDRIESIKRIMEKQKIISTKKENQDIISLARDEKISAINLFCIRNGKLIGKQNFIMQKTANQNDEQVIQAFIEQYYPQVIYKPKQILVSSKLSEQPTLEKAFGLKILTPQKGTKKQFLTMGQDNARNYLTMQKASWEKNEIKTKEALSQLKKHLKLKVIPDRIEVFDISNIQGQHAVGSMIVFTKGLPDKKWYRKFKIKTVHGANDTAMMAEVLKRRFAHLDDHDKSRWPRPDLVILDGGKGQLNMVKKAINLKLPIIALAKKHEDIYLYGQKAPINLPAGSQALYLIQRMRDEAHRFAITFFRKKHQQTSTKSVLDEIPGLGPVKKRTLINKYGDLKTIKHAPKNELAKIVGTKLAESIKENI